MKFNEKVKEGRLLKNLTQQQLADEVGVSLRTLINYEHGKRVPRTRENYVKLAEALGLDLNYLLTEDEEFVVEANERYGAKAAIQAKTMVDKLGGLFAGGELSDEDMDAVMKSMQKFYWDAKEENKKYTPKKYRK